MNQFIASGKGGYGHTGRQVLARASAGPPAEIRVPFSHCLTDDDIRAWLLANTNADEWSSPAEEPEWRPVTTAARHRHSRETS